MVGAEMAWLMAYCWCSAEVLILDSNASRSVSVTWGVDAAWSWTIMKHTWMEQGWAIKYCSHVA